MGKRQVGFTTVLSKNVTTPCQYSTVNELVLVMAATTPYVLIYIPLIRSVLPVQTTISLMLPLQVLESFALTRFLSADCTMQIIKDIYASGTRLSWRLLIIGVVKDAYQDFILFERKRG